MVWSPSMQSFSRILSLDGLWHFRIDPDDVGLHDQWASPDTFNEWTERPVPAPWQCWLNIDWHGVGWYAREITIPADWIGHRVFLRCDSIATSAIIWINGREVGRTVGDYIPHEIELTEHISFGGSALLVMRVDDLCGHITTGFHDVLSAHHGGIWQTVSLIAASDLHPQPNGVAIHADPASGLVTLHTAFENTRHRGGRVRGELFAPDRALIASFDAEVSPALEVSQHTLTIDRLLPWSPESPTLYELSLQFHDANGRSERLSRTFGARVVRAQGSRIELNGKPVQLRGILHWGHEPQHIAPAPTPDQVRAEFTKLRELGFNCVCLCMWYPPPYYFSIADETGMLLWQEHPVWQSSMAETDVDEYKRMFHAFLRRDQQHASVVVVSSTCEHPNYDHELAKWWWQTAKAMLPYSLLQVQTSSFAWSDPELTDLHDEHTYDNNDRWVSYLEDLQHELGALPTKPFVMGETILFTSWVNVRGILDEVGSKTPWWLTPRFAHYARWEAIWRARYGDAVIARFKRQGDRHHLLGRKFQVEQFRRYPNHAGVVMNHLRDVPQCACGFLDDLNHWRFAPSETQGWLGDVGLTLVTPDHRRSFFSAERVRAQVFVANFSSTDLRDNFTITLLDTHTGLTLAKEAKLVDVACGNVVSVSVSLILPATDVPRRVQLEVASSQSVRMGHGTAMIQNAWDLWIFPHVANDSLAAHGVARLEGMPFTDKDRAPDEVEAGYSRGFGLPIRSWRNRLPNPADLVPTARPWWHGDPIPSGIHVILTHKLTDHLIDWMEHGGRVLLFCSKTTGGLGTRYEWLFGQVPLIIERGPLREHDSEWMVDLIGFDLTRTYSRVIPVDDLGLREAVEPIARLCYTHDTPGVRFFDQMFGARVGDGALLATSFDHHNPAGQFLLARCIDTLLFTHHQLGGRIAPGTLKRHTVEHQAIR